MKNYGIIGKNISYSFSKKYFEELFIKKKLKNHSYEVFDLKNLDDIKELIFTKKIDGLNVTIPYKEEILSIVDDMSVEVSEIGACNTLKIKNKKILAYNTDIFGFKENILEFLPKIKKALILGTGGGSKAVKWVLENENIDINFASTNRDKIGDRCFSYENIQSLEDYDMVINTTPLGTFPGINTHPNIPYEKIKKGTVFVDLVYNPCETMFMKKAKLNGGITKNGIKMLYFQAEKSWDIWNNGKF